MFKRIAAFFRAILSFFRKSVPIKNEIYGELDSGKDKVLVLDQASDLASDNVYVAVPKPLPQEVPVPQPSSTGLDDDDPTPVEIPSLMPSTVKHPNSTVSFPPPAADPPPEMPPPPMPGARISAWPRYAGPMVLIPRGYKEALKTYGNPSAPSGKLDAAWERKNMTLLKDLPGTWNGALKHKAKAYVHKSVAPYFVEFLERLERAGLLDEIKTLGTFNFRRKRHSTDPSVELSMHAFGVAHDLNSAANVAWYRTKVGSKKDDKKRTGPIPAPFSKGWRDYWPNGLSQQFVECAESVGYQWGGRWRTFIDPMHIQLVVE